MKKKTSQTARLTTPLPDRNSTATQRLPMAFPVSLVMLALLTIFSTLLPSEVQQRPSLWGLPVILWFWLAVALFSAVLTTAMAWRIIGGTDND